MCLILFKIHEFISLKKHLPCSLPSQGMFQLNGGVGLTLASFYTSQFVKWFLLNADSEVTPEIWVRDTPLQNLRDGEHLNSSKVLSPSSRDTRGGVSFECSLLLFQKVTATPEGSLVGQLGIFAGATR